MHKWFSYFAKDFFNKIENLVTGKHKEYSSYKINTSSMYLMFANFTVVFVSLIIVVFLTRVLGASHYGHYLIVVSFVFIVKGLLELNSGEVVIKQGLSIQKKPAFIKLVSVVFIQETFFALLSFSVTWLASSFVAQTIYKNPALVAPIQLLAVSIFFNPFIVIASSIFHIRREFYKIALFQICNSILKLILLVVLTKESMMNAVFALLLTSIISGVIYFIIALFHISVKRTTSRKQKVTSFFTIFRKAFLFNLQFFSLGTIKTLIKRLDILFLGYLTSSAVLAYYKIAISIGTVIHNVTNPFIATFYYYLCSYAEKKKVKDFVRLIIKGFIYSLVTTSAIAIGILVLMHPVISILFGKEFISIIPAIIIILPANVFIASIFWMRPMFVSLNNLKFSIYISLAILITMLGLMYFLVPRYNLIGATLSYSIANGSILLIGLALSLKYLKDLYYGKARL